MGEASRVGSAQQLTENLHLGDRTGSRTGRRNGQGLYGGTFKEFEECCDVVILGQAEGLVDDEAGDGADPT